MVKSNAGKTRALCAVACQRTPIDDDVGSTPERSWKLSGGKMVGPSRPPVTNEINLPIPDEAAEQ